MTATTPARTPPAPPPAASLTREQAFLHRMPMVRRTLTLVLPDPTPDRPAKAAYVCVTEQRESVRLCVREAGSTLDHEVRLTLAEARTLSEHLNKVCEFIRKRPSYLP